MIFFFSIFEVVHQLEFKHGLLIQNISEYIRMFDFWMYFETGNVDFSVFFGGWIERILGQNGSEF